MSPSDTPEKAQRATHPFLEGNFAPIHTELPLTTCSYTGSLPSSLAGGQYVRNGGNPARSHTTDSLAHYHWFDGDGTLAGVYFSRDATGQIAPQYVNRHILTDVRRLAHQHALPRPLVPSLALFVDPLASLGATVLAILRACLLVVISRIPGFGPPVRKISVANTAVLYHDGRALATCESGPPMRFLLPGLDTVGWFDGVTAEGEGGPPKGSEEIKTFGQGDPFLGWMKQWTTAHPCVDPYTNEMLLYHGIPFPPYVQYSIVPPTATSTPYSRPRLTNAPVPGLTASKFSHDFGATLTHTILLDLPLHLSLSLTRPILSYDPSGHARFGIFPRYSPSQIQWFSDKQGGACCVFHVAAAWDSYRANTSSPLRQKQPSAINLLACRLNSSAILHTSAGLPPPTHTLPPGSAPSRCELYYWRFALASGAQPSAGAERLTADPQCVASGPERGPAADPRGRGKAPAEGGAPMHAFALAAIPLEFPAAHHLSALGRPRRARPNPLEPGAGGGLGRGSAQEAPYDDGGDGQEEEELGPRYVWGCTLRADVFGAGLGRTAKVDALAKVGVRALVRRGVERGVPNGGCVDARTVPQILEGVKPEWLEGGEEDPVKVFAMPEGWYAQEPTFVPRTDGLDADEDDGWLLFYAFDEGQLCPDGSAPPEARSELWVLDAREMKEVVARVMLPQRVPYGLHGEWFAEGEIKGQRGVKMVRTMQMEDQQRWWAGGLRRLVSAVLG